MKSAKTTSVLRTILGVGPLYVGGITALTLIAVFFRHHVLFVSGRVACLRVPFLVLGVLCLILGASLWYRSVVVMRVAQHIKEKRLLTDGVYAWVRHPIYSAFMLIMTGILLMLNNLWFLLLVPIYWLLLTVLMRHTEEKWLIREFGAAYQDYCRRVNCCIPWPRKRS